MRICLLEPYDTGSHGAWLRGYAAHSRHEVQCLTLDGRFWKWRMHGGAVTLARRYREQGIHADLLLASDMLDLSTFRALTTDLTHDTPAVFYLHENQLTYPLQPEEHRDLHYGFINYVSMLCAQRIYFNSHFHLESWFEELPRLLKHFPDYNELPTVADLRARASVLPLGLDLQPLDAYHPDARRSGPATILWSHRWEYDKNPGAFLAALDALAERGYDFRVAFLGEVFVRIPPEFQAARERLGKRLLQFGYVDARADYARWLWRSDIVASTAIHEFFGAALVEALYCNCFPVLPGRLSYPQFIPPELVDRCLYQTQEELVERLSRAIQTIDMTRATSLRNIASEYDWALMAPRYDDEFEQVIKQQEAR